MTRIDLRHWLIVHGIEAYYVFLRSIMVRKPLSMVHEPLGLESIESGLRKTYSHQNSPNFHCCSGLLDEGGLQKGERVVMEIYEPRRCLPRSEAGAAGG